MRISLSDEITLRSVQELAWNDVDVEFLFPKLAPEDFAATLTSRDPRFVRQSNGKLLMSFHSIVVQTPHGNLLVDTCIGNDKERPLMDMFHRQSFPYLQRLAKLGLTPNDIDFVCCTHFHGDHVGWNTRLENGRWVPTFPNARYLFAEPEVRYWEQVHQDNPEHIFTQSWNDSIAPVMEAQLADIVQPDHEVMAGVRMQPAFGHSPGNIVLAVEAGDDRAMLSGDVMHHPVQIERPEWCAVFDQDPAQARVTRKALLEQVADDHTWLIGAHFADAAALRVSETGGQFSYR
ncbi:MAG: MBL fold metallo-hydrolase [Gammaproteobacteria bacterium]|nr:MBL fold metallo-hydrolase [Gammaproteobacteria bacterium]NND54229.1 MBL fold metallo-hydrolase [Gammaproteobacteria bacterium]